MVPETCEPTCTVVTALMVPVAWTTFWMSPFCTCSVKYCGTLVDSSLNAASTPIATRSMAMIVHFVFRYFILHPPEPALVHFGPHKYQPSSEGEVGQD